MGRHRSRSRSRSYSPRRVSRSPPRRKRYDDPRDRYRGGGGGGGGGSRGYYRPVAPSGLLVRNIALDARPEDLRIPFERFGPVKDVYLPKNYYTGEPRGFGFVKFRYAEDAAVAKQQMNHQVIGGREIAIVFAEENRKPPQEMRPNARTSDRYVDRNYRRRSPSVSLRRRYRSYSRSASPPRHDSRERDRDMHADYSPPPRSISPSRERRKPKSSHQSPSPKGNGRGPSPADGRRRRYSAEDHNRSPSRDRSYSPQ